MASPAPRRPDALAEWARAAMPADLALPSRARRERFVGAIASSMRQPLPSARLRRPAVRRLVAAVAAAAALVALVGTGFAQTAGGALLAGISALLGSAPEQPRSDAQVAPAPVASGRAHGVRGATRLRPASAGGAVAEARPPADASSRARSAVERPSPADDPELAMQNRLFADAMNARARGDLAGAVRLLDRLLRRYPASVLGEDARVERFRALARLGDARAAGAARGYLAAYPGGFARGEARQVAGGDR